MPAARLTLTIPEGVWIGDLTRRYPSVTVHVLAALPQGEDGVGLVEVLADDPAAVIAAMREYDAVPVVDPLARTDGGALVRFETTTPLLLLAARDSGVPIETPFEIRDGEACWEVRAPRDRLSSLGEELEAVGVPFAVEYVRESVEDPSLLTDRQRRLVLAAVEAGYYETPRECSLTDLADDLDLAKSTVSETLHRAEGAIVTAFADSLGATDEPVE